MKRRLDPPFLIFIGLCAVMGFIAVVSLAGAISWISKPFAGFLTYEDSFVGTIKSQDWPGITAGLNVQDRIIAVDGRSVAKAQDLISAVKDKAPGTPVPYTVESKDETIEVTVPVAVFGARDFVLTFLPLYLVGLAFYALGSIVFLLKPNTTPSWVFLMLCLSLGTYMITAFEAQSTYYLANFHYFFVFVYPATFFHLGLIFPDKKRTVNRLPVIGYLIYLPAVILGLGFNIYLFNFQKVMSANSLTWLLTYKEFATIARLFTLFCVISLIAFLIHSLFRASTVVSRQRARMILFGVTAAFLLPGTAMASVHFFKVNIPWNFLGFLALAFPASIAYSIVKHNLFDADTIIRRTVGYVIVTAIVIGAYAVISVSFNVFMDKYELAQSKAFPILFTLGVILIFNPLRDRVQALVDRIFFRKEYDYGAIIEKVGRAMTSLLDLGEILKRLSQTFMEDMFINTSSIILLNPAGTEYQVYQADGEKKQEVESLAFQRNVPLMQVMEEHKEELTKYDVIEDPKYRDISKSCTSGFESLHASLMVPLVYQDQVIGSLNLGEKKSGKFYNREDVELLRTLANQGAVAIENARMVEEIIEKERFKNKIMDSFGKYVTSEVRDQILEGRIPLDGELKDVTVLFADLRGFTTMTESTNPKEVVKIINGYFSEMAEAIGQNHGLVLQFIGDEIEAVFGAPSPLEDHPTHAVRAAMEMRKRLVSVNEKLQKKGYAPLRHGIGIHTGNVVAANIGSEDRMSYALVGDTVNAASRIQSLNKDYHTDILMSATTLNRLTEFIKGEKLGATTVKGKKEPVEIFKLA